MFCRIARQYRISVARFSTFHFYSRSCGHFLAFLNLLNVTSFLLYLYLLQLVCSNINTNRFLFCSKWLLDVFLLSVHFSVFVPEKKWISALIFANNWEAILTPRKQTVTTKYQGNGHSFNYSIFLLSETNNYYLLCWISGYRIKSYIKRYENDILSFFRCKSFFPTTFFIN